MIGPVNKQHRADLPRLQLADSMSAMALDLPHVADHPNRLPFSGVLTRLDTPSDKAPNGSKGRKVILTRDAAERALGSLLGMAVNYTATQDNHAVQMKVGVITGAEIQDDAVHIDGFIYASDFPKEAARIQSDKDHLGFSWELANIFVASLEADPLVLTDCVFTGAAILRKDKAAYSSTSLNASADQKDAIDMTKEELLAGVSEVLAPITERLNKIEASQVKTEETMQASAEVRSKVEPHAKGLEVAADKMQADGVGMADRIGHVHVLRRMANDMRTDAAQGRVPSSFVSSMYAASDEGAAGGAFPPRPKPPEKPAQNPKMEAMEGELASLKTKFADLQAAGVAGSRPPERKTISPAITALLAKADLTVPDDGKMSVGKVDEALGKSGLSLTQRMTTKAALAQAGVLAR